MSHTNELRSGEVIAQDFDGTIYRAPLTESVPSNRAALTEALTPGMTEMLRLRFPAWANDPGGYRYAEFIDRVAEIAAEAGCVLPPGRP